MNCLYVARDISMALLLFGGFFRFSELAALTIGDISISDTHLNIEVSQSKTDQYRKGNEVVISRSGKVTCPVSNLERSMKLTGVSTSKVSDFLFKPIVKVRSRYKVIDKVKPLSYTRARESLLVGLLREFVPNTANISLHSFRSGGATTAPNAQVLDRCWKRHDKWRSETAKDRYVEDPLDNRLLVNKSLGI